MTTRSFNHNPETLDYFYPLEHAYLSDFLGQPRPDIAQEIDPFSSEHLAGPLDEDEAESDGIFRPRTTYEGETNSNTLPNAIARIALNERGAVLPQWFCGNAQGGVYGRHYEGRCLRRFKFEPLFLFMLNWADSGPGFSWPESYHVTWFPHYAVYIVTASQDSPDAHGYTDEAIGFFGKDQDIIDGARSVICEWWCRERDCDPEYAWAYLFSEGLVDTETAYAWRSEVYGVDRDGEVA